MLAGGIFLLGMSQYVRAQDDASDIPLGDVARSFRKKPASPESVVDNDNIVKVVDDAESRRAAGSAPVFSLDSGGRNFHVSSPDVTCSLSFSAKSTALVSDPPMLNELPRSELAKLDGPATIDGDSLQVSMHNGTSWELREILIGLTIVNHQDARENASYFGRARIIPAAAGASSQGQGSFQKQPDVTLLLRVKGSAAPSTTAIFRTSLNFALFPGQEWHWAIVRAKGIPPQTSLDAITHPENDATQHPLSPDAGADGPIPPAPPSSSNSSSPNPSAAQH